MAQILDQAMVQLNPADRNAIVLRYFENHHSAKDVAAVFGINESAAQKRLNPRHREASFALHRTRRRGLRHQC